jgi:tetratricopeptide (TPR) repeat protein
MLKLLVLIGNIGVVYQSLGRYDEAMEYYKKALDIFFECLGESHASVAYLYGSIGSVCQTLGRYDEALEIQESP